MGREQATKAGVLLKEELEAAAAAMPHAEGVSLTEVVKLKVYTSPFSRTVETAKLAATAAGLEINSSNFETTDLLVERDFGSDMELKIHHGRYESLWENDAKSLDSKSGIDGETLQAVADRIRKLFQELESRHEGAHLLLVSHGDTLSIGMAAMEGADIKQHIKYQFENAELKRVGAGPNAPRQ